MERMRFAPWGYGGGHAAAPLRAILNRGRPDARELRKLDALAVNAGDTVTFLSTGGGGYGDPYCRDPEAVRRDVRQGFVSREAALSDYGVAITEAGELDAAATAQRRAGARAEPGEFDLGAERMAWEAVFDDATMRGLNRRLAALPKAARQRKRRQVFETAVPELRGDGKLSFATALADPGPVRERLHRAIDSILRTPR
jgi:N-methylhydantoinase B